jgi:ubiquinone/menaquinone biosynthesis C-methylase UbiE/uncharacterized protein YbaR (Trm112 family)
VKESLKDILACPSCGSKLELKILDCTGAEIEKGELSCLGCQRSYLIEDGIPHFLTEEFSGQRDDRHSEVTNANLLYHDMIAEHYEEDESLAGSHDDHNQKRVEEIVHSISLNGENSLLLDLGCGTGNVLKFGRRFFKEAVGVDLSLNMLRIAKSRGSEVMQADALDLPFLSEVFGCVSCFSVVHHIYDQRPFLREIHRVLKKGGWLYTDWDPVSRPKIDEKELKWRAFSAAKRCYKGVESIWVGSRSNPKLVENKGAFNFREFNPDSKELYSLAEFHLPTDGCGGDGMDLPELKRNLEELGFTAIAPTLHWNGRTFRELPRKQRLNVKIMQLLNYLPRDFAENIQVIAKKG